MREDLSKRNRTAVMLLHHLCRQDSVLLLLFLKISLFVFLISCFGDKIKGIELNHCLKLYGRKCRVAWLLQD